MDDFKLVRAVQDIKSITPAARQPSALRHQRTQRQSSAGTQSLSANTRTGGGGLEASPTRVNPNKPTGGALSAVGISPSPRRGSSDLRNRCGGSPRLEDFASPQPFNSANQHAAVADAMGASLGSLDRDSRENVESFEDDAKRARPQPAASATAPIVYGTNPMQVKQLREQNQVLQHAFNDTRSQLVLTLKELRQTAKAKRDLEAEKNRYVSKLEAAGKAVRAVLAAARSKEADLHATIAVLREELEECEQLVVAAAKLRQIASSASQMADSKHDSGHVESATHSRVATSLSGAEKGGQDGRASALTPLGESAFEPPRTLVAALRIIADALRVPFESPPLADGKLAPRRTEDEPPSQMRTRGAAVETAGGSVDDKRSALCSASGESVAVQAEVEHVVGRIFDRVRAELHASLSGSFSRSASGISSAEPRLLIPRDAQPEHPRVLCSASGESAEENTEVKQLMSDVLDRVRMGVLASVSGSLASRSGSGIAFANESPS